VGRQFVLRMRRPLSGDLLEGIRRDFRDVVERGEVVQRDALDGEEADPALAGVTRLVFHYDRRSAGRLRQLIDRVNQA
jgi:hypothetical protein